MNIHSSNQIFQIRVIKEIQAPEGNVVILAPQALGGHLASLVLQEPQETTEYLVI